MASAPGPAWARTVSAVLAVVGLVDSLYLTIVKWNFLSDPNYDGGACGVGGGCDQLQHSVMADVPLGPGLPISLLAVGFYLTWLVLLFMRARAHTTPGGADARGGVPGLVIGRVMLGLALLANVYDVVLIAYAVSLGQFCQFCAVLYVVNLGLAIVTLMTLGESLSSFLKNAFAAIPTRASAIALATFIGVVAVSFFVYGTTLAGVPAKPDPTTNPTAKVHAFTTAGRAERGPANAKIRIVEFADFECPHCRSLFHTLEEVVAKYPDDVHISFLHFPLDKACNREVEHDFHQRACEFATIAECARQQGRFFEAAELLFDSGGTERNTLLQAIAALGVDRQKLDQCLADPASVAAVKADIEQGFKAGVQGTPAVFMNGVEVGGARAFEWFETIIDRHLAATKRPGN